MRTDECLVLTTFTFWSRNLPRQGCRLHRDPPEKLNSQERELGWEGECAVSISKGHSKYRTKDRTGRVPERERLILPYSTVTTYGMPSPFMSPTATEKVITVRGHQEIGLYNEGDVAIAIDNECGTAGPPS